MVLLPISLCSLRCTKQVEAVLDLVPRQRIIRFEGESGGTWFLVVRNKRTHCSRGIIQRSQRVPDGKKVPPYKFVEDDRFFLGPSGIVSRNDTT